MSIIPTLPMPILIPERFKEPIEIKSKSIQQWINTGKGKPPLLMGMVGCGKTHLLYSILNKLWEVKRRANRKLWEAAKEFKSPEYEIPRIELCRSGDMISKIINGISNNISQVIVSEFQKIDYLAIDDIGTERITDWVLEQYDSVINYRYEWCKPTLFATNLSLDEMSANIGERLVSRIVEMCQIVELTVGDRRTAKG